MSLNENISCVREFVIGALPNRPVGAIFPPSLLIRIEKRWFSSPCLLQTFFVPPTEPTWECWDQNDYASALRWGSYHWSRTASWEPPSSKLDSASSIRLSCRQGQIILNLVFSFADARILCEIQEARVSVMKTCSIDIRFMYSLILAICSLLPPSCASSCARSLSRSSRSLLRSCKKSHGMVWAWSDLRDYTELDHSDGVFGTVGPPAPAPLPWGGPEDLQHPGSPLACSQRSCTFDRIQVMF